MNQDKIKIVAELIQQADAVIVGAGSGMSSASGYNHCYNEMFKKHLMILKRPMESEIYFKGSIMFTQSLSSNGDFIPDILDL